MKEELKTVSVFQCLACRCTINRCPQKTPLKVYTTCLLLFFFCVCVFFFVFFILLLLCVFFSYTDILVPSCARGGVPLYCVMVSPSYYYCFFLPSIRHALLEPGIQNGHFSTALQWTHTCGITPSHPPPSKPVSYTHLTLPTICSV